MTDSGSDAAVSLLALIGTTWIVCGNSMVSKRSLAHDKIFVIEGYISAYERQDCCIIECCTYSLEYNQ